MTGNGRVEDPRVCGWSIGQREWLRRSLITANVQRKSMRSSMSSHPSSRRATSRASKKMGGSENFDDDGEDGNASPLGFGFSVGTSGDAGEMIGSI
jgi:hypothetical protein